MKSMVQTFKKALVLSLVLLVICGFAYPLALTGVSQVIFHKQANGSMIEVDGKAVGSELIGQQFTDERFFKGRVSTVSYNTYTEEDTKEDAEGNAAYGGAASGSSNYGNSNPALAERVQADLEAFMQANPDVKEEEIPADLLTASGSGLDPDISPKAAKVQIPAIAKATGLSEDQLQTIVDKNTKKKVLGVLGEERVNVLKTNLDVAKELGII